MKMVRMLMKKRTKMGMENMMQMVMNIIIMITINNMAKNKTSNKMKVHMTMMRMARSRKKDKRDMRIHTNMIHKNIMKMKGNISMVDKKKVKSLLILPNKNTMLCMRFFNSLRVLRSTHTCNNSSRVYKQLNKCLM